METSQIPLNFVKEEESDTIFSQMLSTSSLILIIIDRIRSLIFLFIHNVTSRKREQVGEMMRKDCISSAPSDMENSSASIGSVG